MRQVGGERQFAGGREIDMRGGKAAVGETTA